MFLIVLNQYVKIFAQIGGITRLDPRFKVKGVGKDEELRLLPGSDKFGREGKYYVSKKDAPRLGGLGDTLGGITDALLFQSTDFDRKGSDFSARPELIDINDPSNYLVSQAQQSQVLGGLEQAGVNVGGASSPTAGIKEQLELIRGQGGDDLIDFYSKAGKELLVMHLNNMHLLNLLDKCLLIELEILQHKDFRCSRCFRTNAFSSSRHNVKETETNIRISSWCC